MIKKIELEEKIKNGKFIRVECEVLIENDTKQIENIKISGDFFIYPEEQIDEIEKQISGINNRMSKDEIEKRIVDSLKSSEIIGFRENDLIRLITKAIT